MKNKYHLFFMGIFMLLMIFMTDKYCPLKYKEVCDVIYSQEYKTAMKVFLLSL